jgi:3-deoxy-D-manno-octulosonate cytidylyltransferase
MSPGDPLRCVVVIPARYRSTRLPGKPLADLHGKPMVQHVYERALQVRGVAAVLVATDDQRVADAVSGFGGRFILTSPDHMSGTDRLTEVMQSVAADIYVNLQGDEPLVRPGDIQKLVEEMQADRSLHVATLCHPISAEEAEDPAAVKVILGNDGLALYFSRARLPYVRDAGDQAQYFKHVGVYAYSHAILAAFSTLPVPMIEKAEKLEQLRILAAGYRIRVFQVEPTGPGVDTPEDLETVRRMLAERQR